MKIVAVEPGSTAEEMGLQAGDDLLSINGHRISDYLDFEFWRDEQPLELLIHRQSEEFIVEIDAGLEGPLGAEFEDFSPRFCGNSCIFCFIDQNPKNLRRTLYFKDEDYRLSFVFGNYVTLTNVSRRDLDRIVKMRLSPLYVSVHATDPEIRKKMLGSKRDDHLLQKIDLLTRHGIVLHAQIVLCPGINDGQVLQRTVDELKVFHPQLKTLAIVPVGLTRHRAGLPSLHPVTPAVASKVIQWYQSRLDGWRQQLQSGFVYLADEFYLLAGEPLPASEHYDTYDQIENGVGMCRDFLDGFAQEAELFPSRVAPQRILLVSGNLAAPLLREFVVPRLQKIVGLEVELYNITNRFYGESITVSGLLTGQDIASELKNAAKDDLILLPPNCLNHEGVFLDDSTPTELQNILQTPIQIVHNGFLPILKSLNELQQ